jgi:signal transduction histidine kinase
VQIELVNEELVLEIRDNGKGFNSLNASKGLGLNTITNRVEALGGNVSIDSAPGEGCRVIAHIPLQLAVQ